MRLLWSPIPRQSRKGGCEGVEARPHPDSLHEHESKREPPHPDRLLHKCVEEREMERSARVLEINARNSPANSLPQEREMTGGAPASRETLLGRRLGGSDDRIGGIGSLRRMGRMRPDQTKSKRIKPPGALTTKKPILSDLLMLSSDVTWQRPKRWVESSQIQPHPIESNQIKPAGVKKAAL